LEEEGAAGKERDAQRAHIATLEEERTHLVGHIANLERILSRIHGHEIYRVLCKVRDLFRRRR
jgi:hypothetical protein